MPLDPTAYLVGDLIANAVADLADAPSRISEHLDGEDDVPAPGPERDALIDEITARLNCIADADLAELLAARTGQEISASGPADPLHEVVRDTVVSLETLHDQVVFEHPDVADALQSLIDRLARAGQEG